MFTSGQICDMPSIPPSTLRRYVNQFVEHLSKDATKKRSRRFTERDVAVLARARELIQQGRSPEEVTSLLQVVGEEGEKPEDSASSLDLVPSMSRALTEAVDTARALRTELGDLSRPGGGGSTRPGGNRRRAGADPRMDDATILVAAPVWAACGRARSRERRRLSAKDTCSSRSTLGNSPIHET